MNFNSLLFLLFLPIVVLVHYLLPHKIRWAWLLLASYLFYMSWNPWLIFLILGTTLVSYLSGILIERDNKHKKVYLIVSLVICLGALIFFKYFEFLANSVIDLVNLFPVHLDSLSLNIILPIGISFYTFQTLSYVIDVYRGKAEAERHFGYYALFVSFFPQLIAGPIEKPSSLIPQLKKKKEFHIENLILGFRHLFFGFILKVVVADVLARFVNSVFSDIASANSLALFLAGGLFIIEMYCDFNGYSEIAMGSAELLGIKLTRNFNEPYLSSSCSEFFHRWHYSLNRWFTEYLYIPLGGNRKGKGREILNKVIVFALCGLWHGANWTYLAWGLYAVMWMIIDTLFLDDFLSNLEKKGHNVKGGPIGLLHRIYFLLFMIPAGLIFRAQNIQEAFLAVGRMFSAFGGNFFSSAFSSLGMGLFEGTFAVILLVLMVLLNRFTYRDLPSSMEPVLVPTEIALAKKREKEFPFEIAIYATMAVLIGFTWVALLGNDDASAFAYFQF